MFFVDRSIAIIKPKQPFLDWLNQQAGNEVELTLAELRTDCTVIMVPEAEEQEDVINHIDDIADKLFEMELSSWFADPNLWPASRSLKVFWDWFDVEVHLAVFDSVEAEISNSPMTDNFDA